MQATVLVFDKKEFAFRKGYVDPFYFKERFHVTSTVFIPSSICYQKSKDNVEYDAFSCFYSLDNGTLKVINENKFKEKNKYGINFFRYNTIDKNGCFYAVCYPSLITYFRDKKGDQLDERYNEMQVDDNPWLLKYRLKI